MKLLVSIAVLGALLSSASAQSVTLFGHNWRVQRFDYNQQITWPNPVSPGNTLGLLRIEGAWYLGNDHFLVVTSHQDQSVPTTYANFVLEIAASKDGQGNVTGFSYVRTVVANDPSLLGSPFDLRGGGLAVNSTSFGIGAGGNVLVADAGSSDILRAYDIATGALIPYGPGGVGLDLTPPMTDLTDLTIVTEGVQADWRVHALDETGLKVHAFTLDGVAVSNFAIAGAVNPSAAPGDPKGLAYLPESPAWPATLRGHGGVLMVSMGDLRSGLQAFKKDGTEIAYEPIDNTVFHTSTSSIQPKIEAIAPDPATGRLFLFNEKGSLVDNWLWVLTPDCNGNDLADTLEIQSGAVEDLDLNNVPDTCQIAGPGLCFGDGSGTACPCANESTPGSGQGCQSSLGFGARVEAYGVASLAADTLRLAGSNMPNGPALFVQGTTTVNGGTGAVFGDGLRCVGGTLVRLETVTNVGGGSRYPQTGETAISVRGNVFAPGTRVYQVWYRNAATFCTAGTFNWSNAVSVDWGS